MSRVREIKQKEELQARFQIALGQSASMVSSWLKPLASETTTTTTTVADDPSKDAFFNLPIISDGSGLSLSAFGQEEGDINTIGDYVHSGKSLASLKNKKQRKDKPNGIQNRVHKTDSKALGALKNKMRNTQRGQAKEKSTTEQLLQKVKPQTRQAAQDSDSDEDEPVQRSTKKSFTSFLDAKIKKKK